MPFFIIDNEGITKSTLKTLATLVADNSDSKKVRAKQMKNGKKFTKNELHEFGDDDDDDDDDYDDDNGGGGGGGTGPKETSSSSSKIEIKPKKK